MLRSIQIDGFKSLRNFKLDIKKGLNVFVGPNGSGKTNILRCFELISYIFSESLSDSIAKMGDISSIFDAQNDKKMIEIKLNGQCALNGRNRSGKDNSASEIQEVSLVEYEMELQILLDDSSLNPVRYPSQRITLDYKEKNGNSYDKIHVVCKENHANRVEIGEKIENLSSNIFSQINEFLMFEKDVLIEYSIIDICNRITNIDRSNILFRPIIRDIYVGKPYNIDPIFIRSKESISKKSGIASDGSGLYATLYHLNQVDSEKVKFTEITDQLAMVCPGLQKIEVLSDNDKNIVVNAKFENDSGKQYKLPLSYLSDGTLKWLSLITAILEGKAFFAMEEPENFLHVQMQKEFVDKIRENSDELESDANICFLISTHSESLIDYLSAEELILVDVENGYTQIRRIKNLNLVANVIEEKGLALGWLHRSGLLSQNPEFFS